MDKPSHKALVLGRMLACSLGLAACGDSDGGGDAAGDGGTTSGSNPGSGSGSGSGASGGRNPVTPPTGASGGKLLSDLSEPEILDLCESLDSQLSEIISDDDLQTFSCTLFALVTTGQSGSNGEIIVDPEACQQAADECLSAGQGMDGMSNTTCDPAALMTSAAGCPTTVNEYTACLGASIAQLEGAADTFTCEALADPDVAAEALGVGAASPSSSPECASVYQECPALFGPGPPAEDGCDETCDFPGDGECDDGGDGSMTDLCALGTDCEDCGPR